MDYFPQHDDFHYNNFVSSSVTKDINVPSNDGWIPVEDGLPEEKMEVLCCFENGTVQSLWQNWKNDGLGDYFDDDLIPTEVIAWQPLPERYKGDSNA